MRLVHFNYPVEALADHFEDTVDTPSLPMTVHDMIAVELRGSKRVQIAKVVRVFEVGSQVEVDLYEVAAGERYGPWLRRPWTPIGKAVVVPKNEVLCHVDLHEHALTAGSLERLEALGVIASGKIRDEKLLPGRTDV
jgi:hypothetical protein